MFELTEKPITMRHRGSSSHVISWKSSFLALISLFMLQATGFSQSDCESFGYFLSNNTTWGSDVYRVELDDNSGIAEMTWIKSYPFSIQIAYNEDNGLLYVIRKNSGAFSTLDPSTLDGATSPTTQLSFNIPNVTAAAFHDGSLILGSSTTEAVYEVNPSTGNAIIITQANISGGDIVIKDDGSGFIGSKFHGGTMYGLSADGEVSFIGDAQGRIGGLALRADDYLISVGKASSTMEVYNPDGTADQAEYTLQLNGNNFNMKNGDLASGCEDVGLVESCNFLWFGVHQNSMGTQDLRRLSIGPDGQTIDDVIYLSNINASSIAIHPNGELLYILSGSLLRTIELATLEEVDVTSVYAQLTGPMTGFSGLACNELGEVFASHDGTSRVYRIQNNGFAQPYGPPTTIADGDIYANSDGVWLITSSNLIKVETGEAFPFPYENPKGVVETFNGNILIMASEINGEIAEWNPETNTIVNTYVSDLDLSEGDFAGGCIQDEPIIDPDRPPCFAETVVYYEAGVDEFGLPLEPDRSNPNKVLGEPERIDDDVYASLGYGGTIIIEMTVYDQDGYDVEIVETSFNSPGCSDYPEYADAFISVDGFNWYFAKTVCKSDDKIDIDDVVGYPSNWANYIKLENNDELSTTADGFDLDGIEIVNCLDLDGLPNDDLPGGFADNGGGINMSVFPNPSGDVQWIDHTAVNSGIVRIDIHNSSGEIVETAFDQFVNEGDHIHQSVDANLLQPGTYVYRLTGPDGSKSVRTIILP